MFQHFPSITGFHSVRKHVVIYDLDPHTMQYRPKIKLHGTNAAVQIRKDRVLAQSRSRIITPGDDNMGFARWVADTDYWADLKFDEKLVTIFGEWCGSGIMKGVAISQIDKKIFAIFAIQIGDGDAPDSLMITDPDKIQEYMWKADPPAEADEASYPEDYNIHILPWAGDSIFVDFTDKDSLSNSVALMNQTVEAVELEDPWVKKVFDVSGLGEGVVYYPTSNKPVIREIFKTYVFKAKGEKHKTVKQQKAIQIDPEVAATVNDFVEIVLTEARLEQGVREINRGELQFETKLIGPFIGWIGKDVKKENKDELAASKLEWKQVTKALATKSRLWYLAKLEEF